MRQGGVGKGWQRIPPSPAVLMPMISYLSEGCQHACQRRYSAEVQQRARTAASQHDRQHPELAAMIVKRPAAPLVRDEEAAASNPATPTRTLGRLQAGRRERR